MAIEGITTLGESTLASGYTAGSGTMALVSGASFPAAGYTFSVRVNTTGAIYSCTRSSNTLTVTLESGSDVNLLSGVTVVEVVTARSLYDLLETFNRVGDLANLPATLQKAGQRYQTTDAVYDYIFDGSVWRAIYGSRIVIPPIAANFSWVNQGTASVTSANGARTISGPGAAGTNCRVQVASAPGSTPWTCDALVSIITQNGSPRAGFILRESATGKMLSCGAGGAGTYVIDIDRWASATSFSTTSGAYSSTTPVFSNGFWVRGADDGTNVKFFISPDGFTWVEIYSESRTAFFTTAPDQVGIFFDSEGTGGKDQAVSLIHLAFA